MATTQILAPTTSAGVSSTVNVTDDPVGVGIQAPAGNIGGDYLLIEKQTSAGNWVPQGRLDVKQPSVQIVGAGAYRVRKAATDAAIGADKDE